jgi:Flp pilus assembly pilin Flp
VRDERFVRFPLRIRHSKHFARVSGCATELGKEVNFMTFSFSDWVAYLNARFNREEGQTMAEYGVVLAVITLIVVLALGLLSTAIGSAIDSVVKYL